MDKPATTPSPPAPSRRRRALLYASIFSITLFSCFWLRDASITKTIVFPWTGTHFEEPAQVPIRARPPPMVRSACGLRYWRHHTKDLCAAATEDTWIDEEEGQVASDVEQDPLQVFQVQTPPRSSQPEDTKECTPELMRHTFAFSYGKPFVGNYAPPKKCKWTNVVFNITMTSKGRQFDRLAMLFLDDVEVFRTSTAEPTSYGIVSTYIKDMTPYASLLRKKHKLIFELGNLVNDVYTGSFDVALTATFYKAKAIDDGEPAHHIFPISANRSGDDKPSHFLVPEQNIDVPLELPANTIRAVVSVLASGNENEEFWYTNVPESYTNTFHTPLLGHGSFREIQVLIDGKLAGVAWPEVTVFTGGIVPSLWRPVVGINTFDLSPYDVDITPWLPEILDSKPHRLQIKIVSYDEITDSFTESISNNWITSGRIFVWTDPDKKWKTSGLVIQHHTPLPYVNLTPTLSKESDSSRNDSLTVVTKMYRSISHLAYIETSKGIKYTPWIQTLEYHHTNILSEGGNKQRVDMVTSGGFIGGNYYSRDYAHHFLADTLFSQPPNRDYFELSAAVLHTKSEEGIKRYSDGLNNQRGAQLATELMGRATWRSNKGGINSTTSQIWGETRPPRDMQSVASYGRRVVASGDSVASDWERINAEVPTVRGSGVGSLGYAEDSAEEVERVLAMGTNMLKEHVGK